MIKFSEWEQKNFINSSSEPGLTVIFPSRDIYFSSELLHLMRLEISTCPKTLDQWYELCHPSDHAKISKLENIIYSSHENFFSLNRKLYCGDGIYRNFRLDAFIQRNSDGRPVKLTGNEILGLSAWLADADEGDTIELTDDSGRVKILEAVRVAGVMTLNDITMKEDLERENLILRKEISRRIFSPFPAPLKLSENISAQSYVLSNILNENLETALNILNGNAQLKALKRSLGSHCLNVGVTGLAGGGKSSLVNALTGEKINIKNVPVFFREGGKKSAKIFYQDGRIDEGLGIRDKALNFINEAARVEITIPGALIPENICLVDTPGWDALTGSGALKNILPELDFIIYVMPIRARLKGSDYKFLEELNGLQGGNLIFALTQIDLERDDTEAGKVIRTADEKISGDIDAIKSSMKIFNGSDVEVAAVSAKNGPENFYDRNSSEWKNSNIESVINFLKALSLNAYERALALRAERALKIIERAGTDLLKWKLNDVISNLRGIINSPASVRQDTTACMACLFGRLSEGSLSVEHLSVRQAEAGPIAPQSSLLSSLIASMREHSFKSRFFSLETFACKGKRKAMLLSADRNMSMKLFARLSHDISLENSSDAPSEWLCTGGVMPFPCIELTSHSLSIDENILIAPSDYLIADNINWQALFDEYVPVVSVDLARLESGLSDLACSPYAVGLALSKWVLAFPNAALISSGDYKDKVNEFSEGNGLVAPEFFVFENYEFFSHP